MRSDGLMMDTSSEAQYQPNSKEKGKHREGSGNGARCKPLIRTEIPRTVRKAKCKMLPYNLLYHLIKNEIKLYEILIKS